MTHYMESISVFVGAGTLLLVLFLCIMLTARHAKKIDIRSGMPYWRRLAGS